MAFSRLISRVFLEECVWIPKFCFSPGKRCWSAGLSLGAQDELRLWICWLGPLRWLRNPWILHFPGAGLVPDPCTTHTGQRELHSKGRVFPGWPPAASLSRFSSRTRLSCCSSRFRRDTAATPQFRSLSEPRCSRNQLGPSCRIKRVGINGKLIPVLTDGSMWSILCFWGVQHREEPGFGGKLWDTSPGQLKEIRVLCGLEPLHFPS